MGTTISYGCRKSNDYFEDEDHFEPHFPKITIESVVCGRPKYEPLQEPSMMMTSWLKMAVQSTFSKYLMNFWRETLTKSAISFYFPFLFLDFIFFLLIFKFILRRWPTQITRDIIKKIIKENTTYSTITASVKHIKHSVPKHTEICDYKSECKKQYDP